MLVVIVKKSLHCTLNWVGCFQHCKHWRRPPTAHRSAPPTATGSGLHVTSSGSSWTATVLTTTDDHPPPPVLPAHHPNTSSHLVPPPPPLQHPLAYRTGANCLLKHVYNYLVYPSCGSALVVYSFLLLKNPQQFSLVVVFMVWNVMEISIKCLFLLIRVQHMYVFRVSLWQFTLLAVQSNHYDATSQNHIVVLHQVCLNFLNLANLLISVCPSFGSWLCLDLRWNDGRRCGRLLPK